MSLNRDRFEHVMALFQQACGLDDAARREWLGRECAGDATLLAEVEAMLQEDERTEVRAGWNEPGAGARLLAREVAKGDDARREEDAVHDGAAAGRPHVEMGAAGLGYSNVPVPVLTGHYRILRVLGEGGMGVVYLAEQARPRRLVALKALRASTTSREVLRRFEREAEILARLQHPGIAQIYEAGAADASARQQAYFVMEYVAGLPLTEFAEVKGLSVRSRVALMLRVCEAVEHAHQRGVIHRDLKPGNILVANGVQGLAGERVTADGATHSIKVLDFGVARTLDVDPMATSLHTLAGQLIGTLSYMSPEQVGEATLDGATARSRDGVDTRSDLYALGVILYQLLAKRLPLDLQGVPLPEALRRIHVVEPKRLGEVDRALRGDLEVIVAKAMEKDPSRRYQSVADLRDDLRRYLDGLPIDAKRDSATYVLRKYVLRHRVAVAAAVAALIGLVAFAVYAFVSSQRNAELASRERLAHAAADGARLRAEEQRDRADRAATDLQQQLAANAIERGRLLGQTGNLAAAEDLLWQAEFDQPGSRRVHWALWELYSRLPCVAAIDIGLKVQRGAALAPDGNTVAIAGDGEVEIWSIRPPQRIERFSTGGRAVPAIAFSYDGATLAFTSDDHDIALWSIASRQRTGTLTGHEGAVRALAWHPDGHMLASIGDDNMLRIWNATAGQCASTIRIAPLNPASELPPAPPAGSPQLVFSSDGRALAWPGTDRTIRVWRDVADASAASQAPLVLVGHTDNASVVAFAPDGRLLYSGGVDREIREWDISDFTRSSAERSESQTASTAPEGGFTRGAPARRVLVAPNGTIRDLQVSRDGQRLLSVGWWTLDLWDLASGTRSRSINMPVGGLMARWINQEQQAMTINGDGTIRMWDFGPPFAAEYRDHSGRCSASFSADGSLIASGDAAGKIIVRERATGSVRWTISGHRARIYALKFSPDGTLLATAGADGWLRLWDARDGTRRGEIGGVNSVCQDSIAFSPDGSLLATAWRDQTFRLLKSPSLEQTLTFARGSTESLATRFSPDGRRLVTVARDGGLALWNPDGSLIRTIPLNTSAWTCAFSPDGRVLAAGTWHKMLVLVDAATGNMLAALEGHNGLPSGVAFDPADGAVVASAAADCTVRLWDVQDRGNLVALDAFDNAEAITMDISNDGRWMLSASADGRVKLWDLQRFDAHIAGNREHQMRLHKRG